MEDLKFNSDLAEVVHGQEFMLEFFDEDDRRDDEFLGRTTVQTGDHDLDLELP